MTAVYFILLVGVIGFAGYYLCKTSECLGDALGISQNWVGAVILATITSMPELISGITAVSKLSMPELAIGNALGGNVFNLMFFFALDLFYRKRMLYSTANHGHLLTAALGILMMGVLIFLFLLERNIFLPSLGHMGISALILPIIYLLCMKTLYQFDRKSELNQSICDVRPKVTLKILGTFLISGVVVILAGMALPYVGEKIILQMGWNQAFVGTVFLAIATSCPEMAVSLAAIRLNAVNLALSNLLASNIFNIVIIAVDDAFYKEGSILAVISERNVLTIISGMLMTALVMLGLVYKPRTRIFNTVSAISLVILAMYVINNFTLFKIKD